MRAWLVLVAVSCMTGCGARTGLYVPDAIPEKPPSYCNGSGPTPIFVVSDQAQLFRFDPPTATFTSVGMIACSTTSAPETMAVDHHGTAFVTYQDGTMFEVNLATLSCTPTAFMDGDNGGRFGSCFAANPGGQTESLFLMDLDVLPYGGLVVVDTNTFGVSLVGALSIDIGPAEVTGTGDGRLFAFGSNSNALGPTGPVPGALVELDPTDAAVLSQTPLSLLVPAGFAFAFWGGDFYFFTGDGTGSSTVARLAADGSFDANYAALPGQDLVGAGVSTCAPLE